MLPHQPGFSPETYAHVKEVLRALGEKGPFSGDDALTAMLNAGITNHSGDIGAVLDDLEDEGFLHQVSGASPHWQLADASTS